MKILITDNISDAGIELLKTLPRTEITVKLGIAEKDLINVLPEYDVLVVRSQTKVNQNILNAGKKLKIVARAGQGFDNIDVKAATSLGIAVMNTPAKNSSAAAEHSVALMFALSRSIPQANRELVAGKWERNKYVGVELVGKKLGLLGLGNVGRQVAWRAQGLKMEVFAYDPFVTKEAMGQIGVTKMDFDEVIAQADYLSLHLVLSDETKNIISKDTISKMKSGVRIINCARGGLIDESALLVALNSGKVAGAAVDVFEKEPVEPNHPLVMHPKVVATPHLGASTEEAQSEVTKALYEQLKVFVEEELIMNGVNVPQISREAMLALGSYISLGEKLGSFLSQLEPPVLEAIHIECSGEILRQDCSPIISSVLHGFMRSFSSESLNFVNAQWKAKERGIQVVESKFEGTTGFLSLIRVTAKFKDHARVVAGTVFGKGSLRIVQVDDFDIEAEPKGHMLLMVNEDKPGILGSWSSTLGKHRINIARVHLARGKGSLALALVNVDSGLSEDALKELSSLPNVMSAIKINL